MDVHLLYLGGLLILIWLGGLVGLWKALRGRSGPPAITGMALIEALMLINMATLLLGGAFILKGGGWFN